MSHTITRISKVDYPQFGVLAKLEHANPIPKEVYLRGNDKILVSPNTKFITIVGSRKLTGYGAYCIQKIIQGLRGYDVCIISGLALGADAEAHTQALAAGLPTIAIPGSGLSDAVIYPRTHLRLAQEIIRNNGLLISEYDENTKATNYSFPARNRLMAALADLVIIIEAELQSGSMITARLGLDYHGSVGAVPGPIDAQMSTGPNELLRSGATLIRSADDILTELRIHKNEYHVKDTDLSINEQVVFDALTDPKSKYELIELLGTEPHIMAAITTLEIKEVIIEKLGKLYRNK
jgi:DNA processing protein